MWLLVQLQICALVLTLAASAEFETQQLAECHSMNGTTVPGSAANACHSVDQLSRGNSITPAGASFSTCAHTIFWMSPDEDDADLMYSIHNALAPSCMQRALAAHSIGTSVALTSSH
jgi:hypothetical protein